MFLIEVLKEKPRKPVAFCYGRVNPPTIGHARLFNTTARASMGGDYWIFLSHTQDSKKNPLDYNTKIDFVKAMFPQHADHVSYGSLRTIMEIMEFLYHNNYTDVTYVCGNDRLPAFKELLNKYNGVEGGKTYYKFNSINVISSGPRDPDGDDVVAGASASGAREAAEEKDFEKFKEITGAGRYAKQLYRAVRKGMNIFNEDASGYIPKNKREAKDPRWSNALSVDVTPETPRKNAKALKLI
jgi:hypothetical protein